MRSVNWLPGLLTGLVLSCSLVAPALAASKPAPPDPNAPACVDIERLAVEFRKTSAFARYEQKLDDAKKQFTEELQNLAKIRYLTQGERAELSTLKAKTKQTDAEKARASDLEDKSDKVDSEFNTLSQKSKPSAEETKRIQDISQLRTDASKAFAKEQADRQDKFEQLKDQMNNSVGQDLTKLIEKTAKDLKVGVVYEKHSVLFGGNEITDDVIKKLPK